MNTKCWRPTQGQVRDERRRFSATLDREQPVQSAFNGDVSGGGSRPVSFALAELRHEA